jgi:hypothetical protein
MLSSYIDKFCSLDFLLQRHFLELIVTFQQNLNSLQQKALELRKIPMRLLLVGSVILFKARIRGATDSKSHRKSTFRKSFTERSRQESAQQQRRGGGEKRFPHFLGSL